MGLFWFLAMPMLYHLLFYSVFIFKVTNCFPSVQPALCHEDESSALLQFKQHFVINKFASQSYLSYPKTVSWIRTKDCCSWDGVECHEQTGHVINLDLNSSQLYGSIGSNSSLFYLLQLQRLDLSDNHFNYSQIPSTIARLSRLTHLNLSTSMFSGEIPHEISQLSKLLVLNLYCNYAKASLQINLLQLKQQNLRSIVQNLTNLQVLYLCYVNISSPIPNELSNASSLQKICLYSSGVFGEFPIGIFHLPKLRYLEVGVNQGLIGHLPEFPSGGTLEYLGLSGTGFQGNLPSTIGNLNALKVLALSQCQFSGSIPSSLSNLTQLMSLYLGYNHFKGSLTSSLANLTQLGVLSVGWNNITSKDISWIGKLNRLYYLDLSNVNIGSEIPNSFANLTQLSSFSIGNGNLVGQIPSWILNFTNLGYLDLSTNKLHGKIPHSIFSLVNLEKNFWALSVWNNFLIGEIPPSICNLKSLEFLVLSFNNLNGTIPPCLGTFSENLQVLHLGNNNLSGFIPQTFMKRNSLKMIDLSKNNLHGQLPKALANCRMLEFLDVSNNHINDSFPFWLGTLPELKVLALRYNKFFGVISSPRTCSFPKLHIIDLSQNDFSGNLPSELIQNWESMRVSNVNDVKYEEFYHYFSETKRNQSEKICYTLTIFNKGNLMDYVNLQEFFFFMAIDLSSNKLGGEIPHAFGDLKGLILLNLSNNLFTSSIPSSLGKLYQLEALDLSYNSLTGKIPQELAKLTFLEFLNVSYNHLSGPIPQSTQLDTFGSSSFEGNEGLCGMQLLKKCKDDAASTSATDEDEDSWFPFEFDWKIIVIGYGGGLVFGIAMGSTYNWEKFALLWLTRVHRRVQRRY